MLVTSYTQQLEPKSLARQTSPGPVVRLETTSTPAYPYRQLVGTEIRLLRIRPGKGHDRIECFLEQKPLNPDSRLIFYALSYVWGDTSEKRDILLQGRPFPVTKNLHGALQQIREMPGTSADFGYPEDFIWVDAICINQDDIDERSQQVPRMTEIYHSSLAVIIWLGPNKPPTANTTKISVHKQDPNRDQSLPSIGADKLSNPLEPSTDEAVKELFDKASTLWTEWELSDDGSQDSAIFHDVFGPSWNAVFITIVQLLQKPWFERVWTIQEASLCSNSVVVSGSQSIPLYDLITFLKPFMRNNGILSISKGMRRILAFSEIEKMHYQVMAGSRGETRKMELAEVFERVLGMAGHMLCSDPRDQIYGLLGLVKWLSKEDLPVELTPDYLLSTERIYWQCASYLFRSTGNLRLLETRHSELQNVPSWVPDFRYYHGYFEREDRSPTPVLISPDLRALQLQGILLGHVHDYISMCVPELPDPTSDSIPTGISTRIQAVEQHIFESSAFMRGLSVSQILDHLLEGLYRYGGEDGKSKSLVRETYCRLRKHSHGKRSRCAKRKLNPDSLWIERLLTTEFNHPFILVSDGSVFRLDRCYAEAEPEDIVCLFKGAHYPSLLRPSDEGYVFLSQCRFVSSQLDRNALDDEFWDNRIVQDFRLV